MNSKISQNPGGVFKTFSHKTKINPGNVNDDELMKDIEEITEKITLKNKDDKVLSFMQQTVGINDLRDDNIGATNDKWLKAANATMDNFICVGKIVDGKDD